MKFGWRFFEAMRRQALVPFQERVMHWADCCFGLPRTRWNGTRERCNRFIEEALELCQAFDMSREDAHKIVDYVYNRPMGVCSQEVGGVMVTLAVLCAAHGLDMAQCGETELVRVWLKIEQVRLKQATKKADSALPQGD